MRLVTHLICLLGAASSCLAATGIERFQQAQQKQAALASQSLELQQTAECNSTSCYQFYNAKTKPYLVAQFPDIPWTTGEFYAGSIPVDESDPSRTLFFIFKPATDAPVEEITVWLNGGPGCSSMAGFFQENGPILMQPGTNKPVKNPFAWSKMTNMIWVDQPVGAGLSQGKPTANNEVEAAQQFVGFFKNFQKIFSVEKYKIFVTGESYAGRYVPYIGAEMLDQNLSLAGALVYDPCIGDCGYVQMEVPTYEFVKQNNAILNINQSYLNTLEQVSQDCGYTDVCQHRHMIRCLSADWRHNLVHEQIPPIPTAREPTAL